MLDRRLTQESKRIRGYLAGVVALGLFLALLTVLQAKLIAQVVSGVFLHHQALPQVRANFGWLVIVFFLRAAAQISSEFLGQEGALKIKSVLRRDLLRSLYAQGPVWVRGERGGEVSSTLIEGIESLEEYFAHYLPQLLLAVGIPLFTMVFVFPLDLMSGMLLLMTAPLIPFFMMLIGPLAESKAQQQWQAMSRMGSHFLDVLRGLATLKMFGRSESQAQVIARVSDAFRRATLRVLRIAFLSAFVLELVATVSTALIAVALGLRLIDGSIDFQQAFFILLLIPEVYQPLRNLGVQFHASLNGKSAADRIYALLDAAELHERSTEAYRTSEESHPGVSVREVSYTYPGRNQPVIKKASFFLYPGETMLLAGPSGTGKTTLAELLLGFLHPDEGEIRLNGSCARDVSRTTWLKGISYVPQHPHLFFGTILENLLLGRLDVSTEAFEKAVRLAGVEELIASLPNGYDTTIGEGGVCLSGGQAQRLALARAFLKDAPLLILDEPISGLDKESEQLIYAGLKEWRESRSILVISHRKSSWSWADRVLWLEDGKLVELGGEKT